MYLRPNNCFHNFYGIKNPSPEKCQFSSYMVVVLKGNFAIFYMLAKYVPGDIKYIFTKFYQYISTNNEANRKSQICNFNF